MYVCESERKPEFIGIVAFMPSERNSFREDRQHDCAKPKDLCVLQKLSIRAHQAFLGRV